MGKKEKKMNERKRYNKKVVWVDRIQEAGIVF
jgi:hypothetical protein